MNTRSKQKGLNLIEVLVTITITSIGLMGLISLQLQAVRATTDSGNRSQAIWIFDDIVNRIHANQDNSLNYITPASFLIAPGQTQPPVCAGAAPTPCSSYHPGNAAAVAPGFCTPSELASWDLYEIACGSPKANGFQGNSINYLPHAQLTITCMDPGCGNGDKLTITLQWRAKVDTETITGAARTANSGILTKTENITP